MRAFEDLMTVLVVILIVGLVLGGIIGVLELCTYKVVSDTVQDVTLLETKVLDDGYAYHIKTDKSDEWFKIKNDSFYLDTCEKTSISMKVLHTKTLFGNEKEYTFKNGDDIATAYPIS